MGKVESKAYKKAGVDVKLGDALAKTFGGLAKTSLHSKVLISPSGYASVYKINSELYIAASTDGVGTKLKLAFQLNQHKTVGIDLVAMSVNDLLCVGATPAFFLDYIGIGKLKKPVARDIVKGIVTGCLQAESALVGGETAELPSLYKAGEYDLAGFAVGLVTKSKIIPSKKLPVKPGDVLIGIASSGFHSNGFSLLRTFIPKGAEGRKIAKTLLTPTKIYVKPIKKLIENRSIKALSHITGGGLKNVLRVTGGRSVSVQLPPSKDIPEIFSWVEKKSKLCLEELASTFNMGVGMVAVVSPSKVNLVLAHLKRKNEKTWVLGEVSAKKGGVLVSR